MSTKKINKKLWMLSLLTPALIILAFADLYLVQEISKLRTGKMQLSKNLSLLKIQVEYEKRLALALGQEVATRRTEVISAMEIENSELKKQKEDLPKERRLLSGQLDVLLTKTVIVTETGIMQVRRLPAIKTDKKDDWKVLAEFKLYPENLENFIHNIPAKKMLTILGKQKNPVPNRPDWVYTEINEEVPPLNSPERLMRGALGDMAIYLDRQAIIHSKPTDTEGHSKLRHLCLQLDPKDMQKLFSFTYVGTKLEIE